MDLNIVTMQLVQFPVQKLHQQIHQVIDFSFRPLPILSGKCKNGKEGYPEFITGLDYLF